MIITEQFVMLNFPKTGSSFTRKVLNQLYANYDTIPYKVRSKLGLVKTRHLTELFVPSFDSKRNDGKKSQHGTYRQIPSEHLNKKIVSIVRNPFDRYVSAYLFEWWKKHPLAPVDELRMIWPHFPDLTFSEYFDMLHKFGRLDRLHGVQLKSDVGYNTIQFIQFYFPDPEAVLARFDEDYVRSKDYLNDMASVIFLHQENLNQELYDFLLSLEYPQEHIEFIKNAERQNVTARSDEQKKARNFYTPELVEQVRKKDAFLFELFPEYREFEMGLRQAG